MNVVAPGKLLLLAIALAGSFLYIVFGSGDPTPAWATITLIVGYAVGNGVGAVRGQPQQPLFAPKDDAPSNT